jgi:drug/metabolite transporter (DMT)-like permease
MLAASIANVVQANPTGRGVPMVSFLAWAMVYGTAFDLAYALITVGPPVVPQGWQFWAGTAYLAIIGSVVTFPLHYNLVREIGAGRTAYNAIVTVCVAMLLSTLFEGYRWTWLTAIGAALALLGMGLALRSKSR